MEKDVYYFPHDANAHRDPKCSALINDFGMEGYGLYWMLIEVMHEQKNGMIEKFPKLFDGLSRDFNCTPEALRSIVEALLRDYCLLQEDEKHIWSERVVRNIETRKKKYESKKEAGRLGGIKSGLTRNSKKNTLSKTKQNEAVLEANEQKERKGDEIKKIKEGYFLDESFCVVFEEFISMRKEIKKPVTETAKKAIIKKLQNFDIETAKEMLRQSIENNWQGIFPVKSIEIPECKKIATELPTRDTQNYKHPEGKPFQSKPPKDFTDMVQAIANQKKF